VFGDGLALLTAVLGTSNATQLIEDGHVVTVDVDRGLVVYGRRR
jgi:phosphohistidine swiveling domain-containing protein